jgi:hypothetical protein
MKTMTKKSGGARKAPSAAKAETQVRIHSRPSIGDPEREQELPENPDLPDLDNETVHKTERPEGAILVDDDSDDELVQEHLEDRDEDVSEDKPLRVGHFEGR